MTRIPKGRTVGKAISWLVAAVLGLSMAGGVALLLARAHPEHVPLALRAYLFPHEEFLDKTSGRLELYFPPPRRYTGTWRQWYRSGEKMLETSYVNGKKHGLETVWAADGQVDYIRRYVGGRLVQTQYYENGKLKATTGPLPGENPF